jgi:hypothetical protein
MRGGTRVVTVEADVGLVESRLAAGRVVCSDCQSRLRPWGWARPRGIFGLAGVLRPRRARCAGCLVTHVLLPVTVLLRRAYAVELIGAAIVARAAGWGHRRIAERIEVPAVNGAGVVAGAGLAVGAGAYLVGAGDPPGRGGPAGAQGPGLALGRSAGCVAGGQDGGDWAVRVTGGPRPGDGLAAGRGLFDRSAFVSGMATGPLGRAGNTSRP